MNMNKTYISISITYYSTHRIAPDIHYYRNDGIHPATSTWNKLTVSEASRMMWELVKLGGESSYTSNMFDNAISERKVTFWGRL